MKLKVWKYEDCPKDLQGAVVSNLFLEWNDEYAKHTKIYSQVDLHNFLSQQYLVLVFSNVTNSQDEFEAPFVSTITISNDIGQPSVGYKSFWFANLFVEKKFRNRNIGTTTIDYAESILKNTGISYVSLSCSHKLVRFYKSRGYKEVGFHPLTNLPIMMKSLAL